MKINEFTGYIMNKDIEVARVENNIVAEILHEKMCPLLILRKLDFSQWVMSRTIDLNRNNYKLIRKALNIVDSEIAIKSRCRAITDNFWFKRDNSI